MMAFSKSTDSADPVAESIQNTARPSSASMSELTDIDGVGQTLTERLLGVSS